tara:strand:- start:926 stop:1918 length:993 start_codon:yes stop_codon:yes gene_type:complete
MSYLNINYSTLEDAWGSNFEKSKKKKNSDVCNVYNKRNSTKTSRPYKSFQESSHIKPMYEDEDYTKYYGYKDGRPFSRKSNKLSKYNLKFPYKRPSVSNYYISDEEEEYIDEEDEENIYEESFETIKPIIQSANTFEKASSKKSNKQPKLIRTNFSYIDEEHNANLTYKQPIVIEEENDDDDYIQEEVFSNLRKKVSPTFKSHIKKQIPLTQPEEEDEDYFTNIVKNYESDEEFDTYLSTKKKANVYNEEDEYANIMQSVYEEHTPKKRYKQILDEEFEEEDDNETFKTSKKKMKERIFLDLMLYTISGVILIFIMEQFIQIGMKIKTTI